MEVSIIIVNYNTKNLLKKCIESIYQYTKDIEFEIIVVDNASTDGSQQMIKDVFPIIILIESPKNLGFGKANNLASKYAKGVFLFFLNSDTILIENSIKKLHEFFLENEEELKIGVLGCNLIDENGNQNNTWHQFPTPNTAIKENFISIVSVLTFRLLKIINTIRKKYTKNILILAEKKVDNTNFGIGFVVGADMFMRKSLFDIVGGFDERFFLYFEETDLQLNLFRKGYRNYIDNNTKIIHLEGASSSKNKIMPNKQRKLYHKSKIYYFKKNFRSQYLLVKSLDKIMLYFQVFNKKYTKDENKLYIKEVLKIY